MHIIEPTKVNQYFSIGRAANCSIRLDELDTSVSPQQAVIKMSKGRFTIEDAQSRCGTLLLTSRVALTSECVIVADKSVIHFTQEEHDPTLKDVAYKLRAYDLF